MADYDRLVLTGKSKEEPKMFNANKTEYHKIENLYERDMEKGSPTMGKLKFPLTLKNPTYSAIKEWNWTEKVDGMNIRAIYTPAEKVGDQIAVPATVDFRGKTDKAVLTGYSKLLKWLAENLTVEKFQETFSSAPVVLYLEGYGAGIQKGGAYRPDQAGILFDVFMYDEGNVFGGWWLNYNNVSDIAGKLGIQIVPYIGTWPLEHASILVQHGMDSIVASQSTLVMEGLVGKTAETLYDKRGHRLVVKLKTKDFPIRDGALRRHRLTETTCEN